MGNFPLNLKMLRKQQKLTQTELANILNVAFSTVSMWERGQNQPDMETILKLAGFFNVSTDFLLGLEDEYGNKIESKKSKSEDKKIMIQITDSDGQNQTIKLTSKGLDDLKKQLDEACKENKMTQSDKKKKDVLENDLFAEYQKISQEGIIYNNNIPKLKENNAYFREKADKNNK